MMASSAKVVKPATAESTAAAETSTPQQQHKRQTEAKTAAKNTVHTL
jgi:hypothetical protein